MFNKSCTGTSILKFCESPWWKAQRTVGPDREVLELGYNRCEISLNKDWFGFLGENKYEWHHNINIINYFYLNIRYLSKDLEYREKPDLEEILKKSSTELKLPYDIQWQLIRKSKMKENRVLYVHDVWLLSTLFNCYK